LKGEEHITWKRVQRVSCLLLLVVIVYGAYSLILNSLEGAQVESKVEGRKEPSSKEMTPTEKRYFRDRLENEIAELENDTKILSDQKFWLDKVGVLQKLLDEAKKRNDSGGIKRYQEEITQAQTSADTKDTSDQVNEKIKNNKMGLKEKKDLKYKIETELFSDVQLETAKTKFRIRVSRYFTLLIAAVIVGFFLVAFRDQIVRREIFSGQFGIQFITLFSLVIAIILFGIMGILEGKEQTALLGGLSGYILGRTTSALLPLRGIISQWTLPGDSALNGPIGGGHCRGTDWQIRLNGTMKHNPIAESRNGVTAGIPLAVSAVSTCTRRNQQGSTQHLGVLWESSKAWISNQ
jgi:hypothetical protein